MIRALQREDIKNTRICRAKCKRVPEEHTGKTFLSKRRF